MTDYKKVQYQRGGNGGYSTKIPVKKLKLEELGISQEEKEIYIEYTKDSIIIKKIKRYEQINDIIGDFPKEHMIIPTNDKHVYKITDANNEELVFGYVWVKVYKIF